MIVVSYMIKRISKQNKKFNTIVTNRSLSLLLAAYVVVVAVAVAVIVVMAVVSFTLLHSAYVLSRIYIHKCGECFISVLPSMPHTRKYCRTSYFTIRLTIVNTIRPNSNSTIDFTDLFVPTRIFCSLTLHSLPIPNSLPPLSAPLLVFSLLRLALSPIRYSPPSLALSLSFTLPHTQTPALVEFRSLRLAKLVCTNAC